MRILGSSRNLSARVPPLAFLDASGKVVYNRSGETAGRRGDTSGLEEILRKASPGPVILLISLSS